MLTYSQEIKSIQFKLKECQQQISALPKVHAVLHIYIYSQEEHTFKNLKAQLQPYPVRDKINKGIN